MPNYIYNDEDNYPMIEDPFDIHNPTVYNSRAEAKAWEHGEPEPVQKPITAAGTAATTIGRAKPARSAGTTSMIAITTPTWTITIRPIGVRITISTRM